MIEYYLIITGLIFFAWLFVLVRQAYRGAPEEATEARPIVPVNLLDGDEAVVVAEERGRIVYANARAHAWFGTDGGTPSLSLMAQMVQPGDALLDLVANAGHTTLRLGARRLEAMSHPIPAPEGQRMVIVLREMTGAAHPATTDYDPLHALTLQTDIALATGGDLALSAAVDAILRVLEDAVPFDSADLMLWHAESQTLRPVGHTVKRSATGSLIPPEEQQYPVGEGFGGWIALYRQPLVINDAANRPDVLPRPGQAPFESFLGIPLLLDNRLIGTLELTSRTPNAYSQRDTALLQALGGQIVAAVEAARIRSEQNTRMYELSGLQHISGAISQLGDPHELYGQLTQRIAQLMNVELCGILLYDEDEGIFRSQPPFHGVPEAVVRGHRLALPPDTELYDALMHHPWWYTNAPTSSLIAALGFTDVHSTVALRRVAVVPMVIGTRRIGLLLVANKHGGQHFSEADMRSLIAFGNQAAIVVENARLYADEQRRNRELAGLQQIAQTMGALRSAEQLYGQITQRIARLMGVEQCGLLLYDPQDHVLVSQRPFYGLEDEESVSFYQLPSPPGSVMSELWQDRATWHCNDLRHDPLVHDTDLVRMAAAVGIRQTAIAPLVVRGSRRGIIQVSNRLDGADFTEDDARILSIFAGQAAILIDNAQLYGEMQRRTHQAEGLRVITEFASQARPLADGVEQILIAIANLFVVDVVSFALIDEESGRLTIRPEHVWGAALDAPTAIDLYDTDAEHAHSALMSRRPVRSGNLQTDDRLPESYHALAAQLGLRDAIQVPLVIHDRAIGELTIANRTGGEPYDDSDVQLLSAIATQIAAMLDRMRLYSATDQSLRERVQQLEAIGRVGREMRQLLDVDRILDVIRGELLRSTAASGVSVALLADARDWPTPDTPLIERRFGETEALNELTPIELAALSDGEMVTVDDYDVTDEPAVPRGAHAALCAPIAVDGETAGVLHLFSGEPSAFDQRAQDFVAALVAEAGLALDGARRYQAQLATNQRLRTRADRMGRIFEVGELFRRGASLAELLEEVAESIRETIGFNSVLISLVDEDAGVMRRTASAGLTRADFEQMRRVTPPLEQAQGLLRDEYRVSNSYFLPAEGSEDLTEGLPTLQVIETRMGTGTRGWHPDDLLLVPFYGAGGRLLGLMSVDNPRSGRRPDQETVEALEVFAGQAAFSIENFRLIARIQQEAEATRRERDRLAQLHLVASEIQRAVDVPARLQVVAEGIHQAGWGKVFITLRDERLEPTALIQAGFGPDDAPELHVKSGKVWRAWISDLAFHELKLGAGYYLRYDRPWVRQHVYDGQPPEPESVPPTAWHPEDTFYLTLVGQDQKRIIGIIGMREPTDGRVPTPSSLQPFELFASQAAAAIETTRLYLETVRAAEQEARLNELMEAVSGSLRPEFVIEAIGHGLQQMVPFTRMHVALRAPSGRRFELWSGEITLDSGLTVSGGESIGMQKTALGRAYGDGEPRIYDLERDDAQREQFSDLRRWYGTGERSALIVPMIAGGQSIGALHLGSELAGAPGFRDNLALIQRLANLSAVALDNARLFAETQNRAAELDAQARRLGLLNRVSTRVTESIDPEEIYQTAMDELQTVLGAQYGGVLVYEDETAHLVLDTHPDSADAPDVRLPLSGNPSIEEVRRTQRPVVASDVMTDPRFTRDREVLGSRGTRALMVVPLIVGEAVIGSIGLDFTEPREFTDAEIELAGTIASQVSLALDKARLLREAEQRAREMDQQAQRLAFLNRVSARLAGTLDPQEIYHIVLLELQEALGVPSGGLMLIQEQGTVSRLVLSTHPMDANAPEDIVVPVQGNPLAQQIIATQRPLVVPDVINDPRFAPMKDVQIARHTYAMMIVPIVVGDTVVGTIGLDHDAPREFTETEIELAMTTANQAALAFEKARLFTETQRRAAELDVQAQQLALVNRISAELAATLDPQEIYRIVLGELAEMLDVPVGGLVLFENEMTGQLVLSYPFEDTLPDITLNLADNRSIERVRETHQPVVSPDVLNDPMFEQVWDVLRQRNTVSLMIVPLLVGDTVIGTIGLDSDVPRTFTETEIELAETIASQASLAVEKARLYNETLGLTIFNQAVVESIRQGIVVLNRDLSIRRINSFMVEHYGWPRAAVGQHLFEFQPEYEQFLRQPVAVALGMGEPQAQYEVERGKDGQRSIRNYYVYPMLEGRAVTGIVLLVEDVTERALLEADLNARAMQMAALSEVSSQITSTLEPDQVVTLILDALGRVIPYDGVSLWLRSAEREDLEIVAARGYQDADSPDAKSLVGLRVEIPFSPLFREMAENAQVINAADVSADDPRFPYGMAAVYKNWLGAPLISKGNVVGVLTLEKREPGFYNSLHEQLALTFANQAAVALDNAQLFQETRFRAITLDEQAQRLALLNRVSLALAQSLDLENILEIALRETAIALDLREGSAMQIDHPNQIGRVVVDYPRGDAPPDQVFDLTYSAIFERVRDSLIPLVIENVSADPHADELRSMMRRDDVASTMLVPLVIGGMVIGILRLDSVEPHQFTMAQVELAQTIASQAAIAVQNASLFEQSSVRTRELETLFESAQATAMTLDLNEVIRRVTTQFLSALRADASVVYLWDDINNLLELRGEASARPELVDPGQPGARVDLAEYPLREQALRDRRLIVVRRGDEDLPPGEAALMAAHHATSRMLLPLIVNDVSSGLVEIETVDEKRFFKSEEMRLARTLASQAAISIENARLQTETRRTVEELYIINDMSTELSSATDLDALLAVLDTHLPSLTNAEAVYVALYDREMDRLSFPLATAVGDARPVELAGRPLGRDEFSTIIRRQAPLLLVGDNLEAIRHSLSIETLMPPETAAFVGVPLFAGDDVIGALAVRDDHDPLAFSANDQRLLTTVGSQLGVAIQSVRLFQQTLDLAEELEGRVIERTSELEQERQHLSTLYQITTELATSLDMDRLLHRALEMVAEATNATQGAILAIDPVLDRLSFRAQVGWDELPQTADGEPLTLAPNEGLAGWAIQKRQNVIVDDVQQDPRWLQLTEADALPRAAMVALIAASDEILGVMLLYSEDTGAFNEDHLRLVAASTNQIANAMNNAELYTLIRDQAERLGAMLRQEQVEATKSNAILDSVADGVIVADQDGTVIVFNSTAERILGVKAAQVLGHHASAFAGLYGTSGGRWFETVNRWVQDPVEYQPGEFLEERLALEDGRIISVRLSPVSMGTQFLGTVSVFRDITREVEVDRLKSEFVATVSHELRTPMTSIKGYADLLLLGAAGDISDQQQHFLDVIKQNADRLSILVNDLLDISRIDQQRVELKADAIDVTDVLDRVVSHLRGRIEDEKRDMAITFDVPDDADLHVWGDYDKIAQIMTNLADNALNYTPDGGTITLAASRETPGFVQLSVADTGIGIPPEVGARIFERFFRGDESQELVMDIPGTGLGLAIVREYVTMHQGRIWFESEEGQGTTFYVELPDHALAATPEPVKSGTGPLARE